MLEVARLNSCGEAAGFLLKKKLRISSVYFCCDKQVTIQLEPMFKRSITYKLMKDDDLEQRIVDFAKKTYYGDINWHPSQGQAIYRYDFKVPVSTPGEGVNDFTFFQPQNASVLRAKRNLGIFLTALSYSFFSL